MELTILGDDRAYDWSEADNGGEGEWGVRTEVVGDKVLEG
jgi:hypothetical protein